MNQEPGKLPPAGPPPARRPAAGSARGSSTKRTIPDPDKQLAAVRGSSTLLVTLILLLLSGSCLALLMATQTQMLIASGQKLQVRLLAAAEGGLQLAVARGVAGATDPTTRTVGVDAVGAAITVEVGGLTPVADGACHLCMANLDGPLSSLGGLRRVSHLAAATAVAPGRLRGLPAPVRELTAVVDLMPWPAGGSDGWDLGQTAAAARGLIRDAALSELGAYDEDAPLTVARVVDPETGAARTVAIGGLGRAGRFLYGFELSPEIGPLWRFADGADMDGNGAADLGFTVSKPAILPLRIGDRVRLVAVFGGGFDPESAGEVGNWLYFVGLDGGQLLYKRRLDAPVTAAPAAVDTVGDGLADRIYAGTTAGSLYRVDVSTEVELEGGRVPSGAWRPRLAFETGALPIHHPPAVIPTPALGAHALALGAGGGEDPGAGEESVAGGFFLFVDRGAGGPGSADELPRLDPESPHRGVDRLATGLAPADRGWSLTLADGERLASSPLASGGLLTFYTWRPAGPGGGEVRKYALRPGSGDAAGRGARSRLVEQGAAWPSPALGTPTRIEIDHPGSLAAPLLEADEVAIIEGLREQMPERCRFDGSRLRLTGPGPGGSPIRLAVLPVCRIDVDWAEERR